MHPIPKNKVPNGRLSGDLEDDVSIFKDSVNEMVIIVGGACLRWS